MSTILESASLVGRVGLVTGGAGHIGSVLCRGMRELGCEVVSADLPDALARRPSMTGSVALDLRDPAGIQSAIHEVVEQFGRLDILVHCGAYVGASDLPGWNVSLELQTLGAWEEALRVNLTSAFLLAQAVSGPMRHSGKGNIVFVSSIYGKVAPDPALYEGTGINSPAAYGASKGGLVQLARHLASHYAPDIRVNVLSPGGVYRHQPETFVERYCSRTPLGRMATEEDLTGPLGFLVSDMSAYVTGHELVVDGGWTVR